MADAESFEPDYRMMLSEAKREVAMRQHVYEKRVTTGEMSVNDARRKIALMQAIVDHLQPFADAEQAGVDADRDRHEPRLW